MLQDLLEGKDIKDILFESDWNAESMGKGILKSIKSIFPKSFVVVKFSSGVAPSIWISFTLAPKNEWVNGIKENDPAYHSIHLWGFNDEGDVVEVVRAEISIGGRWSQLGGGGPKFGWRNKKGSPEAIIRHIGNYFKKVKKVVDSL